MLTDRNCLVACTVNTQTRDKDAVGILALAGKLLDTYLPKALAPPPYRKDALHGILPQLCDPKQNLTSLSWTPFDPQIREIISFI